MVMCRRLLVLTGAGCSTESAVPDYRGPQGAYNTGFKPMTHQQVSWQLNACGHPYVVLRQLVRSSNHNHCV